MTNRGDVVMLQHWDFVVEGNVSGGVRQRETTLLFVDS